MLKPLLLLTVLLALLGCNKEEKVIMHSFDGAWDKNATQEFTFKINDSKNPKNIIFVVRNNNKYPYSNLRLFCSLTKENDKPKQIDTLNYYMAKPNGEWLGSGFGETKELMLFYKKKMVFPKDGKYTLRVKQAMRKDKLVGIEDFGIKLINTTSKQSSDARK